MLITSLGSILLEALSSSMVSSLLVTLDLKKLNKKSNWYNQWKIRNYLKGKKMTNITNQEIPAALSAVLEVITPKIVNETARSTQESRPVSQVIIL